MGKAAVKRLARLKLPGHPTSAGRIISTKAAQGIEKLISQSIQDRTNQSPTWTSIPENTALVDLVTRQLLSRGKHGK